MITLHDFPLKLSNHEQTSIFSLDDEKFQLRKQMAYFHDNNFPILMHKHDFFELNIIVRGNGCHYMDKNRFLVKRGDTLIIPPNVFHGYVPYDESNFSIFHLLIDKYYLADFSKEIEKMPYIQPFLNLEPMLRIHTEDAKSFLNLSKQRQERIFPFLNNLVHLAKKKDVCSTAFNFYTFGLLGELAYYMFEGDGEREIKNDYVQLNILKSINYMNMHFQENITLDLLANHAHMSRSEYCIKFKKYFGDTPMHYLLEMRLNKAAQLLQEDNLSITEIALECGFFDNSHMTRFFHQKYNMSPREYRKTKS